MHYYGDALLMPLTPSQFVRASGYKFTVEACEAAVGLSYSDEIKVFEWTDEKDEFAAGKDSQWSQWAAHACLGAQRGAAATVVHICELNAFLTFGALECPEPRALRTFCPSRSGQILDFE